MTNYCPVDLDSSLFSTYCHVDRDASLSVHIRLDKQKMALRSLWFQNVKKLEPIDSNVEFQDAFDGVSVIGQMKFVHNEKW